MKIQIMDVNDFFMSGCLYTPEEVKTKVTERISAHTHIPTRKEWEEYRDELLTAYRERYGHDFRNYSVTHIARMAEIEHLIGKIADIRFKRDNQFVTDCLIADSNTEVFDIYKLEFKPIEFGTAKFVSILNY